MITRVKNKTSQPIASIGLNANETKVIFYNRPFWINEAAIRAALIADQIELLNDYNDVVVSINPRYVQGFTETYEFNKMCSLFDNEWAALTEEDKEDILEEVGNYVLQFIKAAFRRANVNGYSRANLLSALGNIPTLLRFGDISAASTAANNIQTDAFFTTVRKARLKAILDAVDLS